MAWRDIISTASCALAAASSVRTGADITFETGVSSDSCGIVTRSSTSPRVRMPRAAPPASTTTSEPMCRPCISASACASGVSALTAAGGLRAIACSVVACGAGGAAPDGSGRVID